MAWILLAALSAGCTSAPETRPSASPPVETATPASPSVSPSEPSGGRIPPLRLEAIASVEEPVAVAVRGDTIYVAEKAGRVRAIREGHLLPGAVLDLRRSVSVSYEQGLLGLAIDPSNNRLYVNYTDTAGDTRVVGFAFDGTRATQPRQVLRVDQPFANHNGGHLMFGPDGYLYVFLGDGGGGGDPSGNGQSLRTMLGKILRLDVSRGRGYAVPDDNPFVGRSRVRPEIWAYGLRNPWRAAFDRETGELWIADVGQGSREEINLQPASSRGGENYGWSRLEGSRPFRGSVPGEHVLPVYQYGLDGDACAVVGGVPYRGSRIPSLEGRFLFADHCIGMLRALRRSGSRYVADDVLQLGGSPTAFGEDADGEVIVLLREGTVARLTVD